MQFPMMTLLVFDAAAALKADNIFLEVTSAPRTPPNLGFFHGFVTQDLNFNISTQSATIETCKTSATTVK